MIHCQLLPYAVLALTERVDPTPHRRHALADIQIQPVTVDGRITPSTSASEPRVRAFHARGSSVMCPLSLAPFRSLTPPVGLVICGLAPPPAGVSLPHDSRGFSRFCSVTPPDHFSMTARTSAYPRRYPRPSLLAGSHPARHAVGTSSCRSMRARVGLLRSQFPWFASVGRCSPPGFSAVQTGQYRRLPAPYPVPFGSSASASCAGARSRWLTTPLLALPIDAC
jgi:hypothetical protein